MAIAVQIRDEDTDEHQRLYDKVAARVRSGIASGTLRPGDRLPSIRRLSQQENVSISTVLQALLRLEDAGLIETRPKSGHYVRERRPMLEEPKPSTPAPLRTEVSVSRLISRVYEDASREDMIHLGTAVPAPSLLPGKRIGRLAAAIARDRGDVALRLDMPLGRIELRKQVARRSFNWGCAFAPDDIIATCGGAEALTLSLMAVAKRGDAIAIESPSYYGVLQTIEALGLRAVELPTHPRHGVDVSALAQLLSKRKIAAVLLTTNFSNPLGALMPDEHKKELVQLLAKHDVPLIEDDVYGDLHFGETRPHVARSFDRKGLVLLCSSFSKTLAPGYRIGWIAPGRYRERVELLKFAVSVATPTLPQLTIAEVLAGAGYDRHLRTLSRHLARQVQQMTQAVTEHFPAGTRLTRPEGGFVLWIQLPEKVDALKLHARASEAGISIAPGPLFSPRQQIYRNFIRVSCGHPWSPLMDAAVMTLGSLVRQLA